MSFKTKKKKKSIQEQRVTLQAKHNDKITIGNQECNVWLPKVDCWHHKNFVIDVRIQLDYIVLQPWTKKSCRETGVLWECYEANIKSIKSLKVQHAHASSPSEPWHGESELGSVRRGDSHRPCRRP